MPMRSKWSLDAIFDQMPDPVVIADVTRTIVNVNPATTRVFGYHPDELLGRKTTVLYADPKGFDETGKRIFNTSTSSQVDESITPFRRKDGSVFQANLTGSKFCDENGDVVGFFGIIRDISGFVELQEQKRESELLFETALEAIPDGFVIFDENDRLITCNTAYRQLYAASAPAIRPGVPFEEIIRFGVANGQYPAAGETRDEQEAWIQERLDQHANPSGPVLQKIGEDRWLQIEEQCTERGYTVGIRFDVSDLKRAEENLAAANRGLKARTAALEEFAMIVSHDLQAPLRHMSIFADMLIAGSAVEGETARQVEQIGASAKRMRALVRSLLDYCILAYGKVNRRLTNVGSLVAEATESLGWSEHQAPAKVVVRSDGLLSLDPDLMTRVFQNIFENAGKHAGNHCPQITVDVERVGGEQVIAIADDGAGIPPSYSERIFQMFRRLARADRENEGMGVGLALCKQIVESHGGRIWLDTEYRDGARFCIALPDEASGPVRLARAS